MSNIQEGKAAYRRCSSRRLVLMLLFGFLSFLKESRMSRYVALMKRLMTRIFINCLLKDRNALPLFTTYLSCPLNKRKRWLVSLKFSKVLLSSLSFVDLYFVHALAHIPNISVEIMISILIAYFNV